MESESIMRDLYTDGAYDALTEALGEMPKPLWSGNRMDHRSDCDLGYDYGLSKCIQAIKDLRDIYEKRRIPASQPAPDETGYEGGERHGNVTG